MVSRENKQEDSDLDWIQALFPNDKLYLDERGTLTSRKALLRSKSTTLKLQRALSRNSSKNESSNRVHPLLTKRQLSSPEITPLTSHGINNNGKRRQFIMESPVQFTIGVQSQDRHLFLFHDFLLIAKLRPSGTYKLKEKVLICELWISDCIEEISEVAKTAENSFVLGWPTTNVVATFRSHPSRTLWKSRLEQLVHEAKENEGLSPSSIHVSYSDAATKQEYVKTLQITNSHTALDCVRLVLRQLFLPDEEARDYQLWVRTGKDESPYPLVGHEFPFCIKMNLIRELLRRSDLDVNVSHVTTDSKCAFILRRRLQSPCFPKKSRKGNRRQTLINWPFKRQVSKSDSVDSALPSSQSGIFGWQVANAWNSGNLPPSIVKILSQLYSKGPQTVGIFRKSANARVLRETKDMLLASPSSEEDLSGLDCLENSSPVVLACLLKEFLRSLSDCLLQSSLYYEWLDALDPTDDWRTRQNISSLLSKLPPLNLQLLKHLLSVLHCVAQNSSENKMCADNLGVCIGPSLLSPATLYSSTLQSEDVSKKVPKVIAYLIENYPSLFGEEQSKSSFSGSSTSERKDSGIKEREDSLQDANGEYHRDDSSSIDSLDRDLFYQDLNEPFSPKPTSKTKVSLTNLSRDSGLTLSDNQLYTPEEEMEQQNNRDGGETSGVDSRKNSVGSNMTKSVPHQMDTMGTSSNEISCMKSGFKYNGIDGSCHDLVHRRRYLNDEFFKTLSSLPRQNAFDSNGFQTPRRDSHGPVKLRDHKRLSRNRRQVQSSFEPLQRGYNGGQSLWRSASEESLMRKYSTCETANDFQKRPAMHRKGRAPSPPRGKNGRTLCRSQRVEPDIQAVWFANHSGTMDWKRSQSTSKIDQLVNGTPIQGNSVSPSDETDSYAPQLGDMGSISCGELHIYENINNLRHTNRMSPGYSEEFSSHCASTPKSKQEPPSYEEAVCRRNILRRRIQPQTSLEVTDQMRQEQTNLSARARQLYEESLKLYNNQASTSPSSDKGDLHRAVSVKVSSSDESTCSNRSSGVKQRRATKLSHKAAVRSPSEGGSSLRFRQLPPVHVTDEQISGVRSPKNKVIALQRTWRECPDVPDDLQGSINWSVAQLRSLFNPPTSANNNTCSTSSTSSNSTNNTSPGLDKDKLMPPPYRPPPPTNDNLLRDHKRFDHDKPIVEESFV